MSEAAAVSENNALAAVECLDAVDRLFVRALKTLGDEGQRDLACRIAAEAWSATRKSFPDQAQKFNGVLHYLTRTTHRK